MSESIVNKYTNELRLTILENSLFHEFLITKSLGDILEIETEYSYSLSDKSSSLSLAAKIHLLMDLNCITKQQKPKLFFYLEIRNQFLHNWTCKTFEDCFKSLDKTFNALKKLYPPNSSIPLENQMIYCYNSLSDDIVDIAINHLTMKVIKTRSNKIIQKEKLEGLSSLRENVLNVFLTSLNSPLLEKYRISEDDKRKLLQNFALTILN